MTRRLELPTPGLVIVWSCEGSGAAELTERLFEPAHVLRARDLRRIASADPRAPRRSAAEGFELLLKICDVRLRGALPAVVELEAWPEHDLGAVAALARQHSLPCHLLGLDVPPRACRRRLPELTVSEASAQRACFDRGLATLRARKGVAVERVPQPDEVSAWSPRRLACDRRAERGPFDLIGDVHGCMDELEELLERLGYRPDTRAGYRHPLGRRLIFLGDLTDRGPRSLDALRLAMRAIQSGEALGVRGNHDDKLARALAGRKVSTGQGLGRTLAELEALPPDQRAAFAAEAATFLARLPSHLVLEGGDLIAVHGGISEALIGREGGKVDAFALYGAPTGKQGPDGFPERGDWAATYRGTAWVVCGHTPTAALRWRSRTICIDQGCVFGGALTALRWPERETVSVLARRTHARPRGGFRPLLIPASEEAEPAEWSEWT